MTQNVKMLKHKYFYSNDKCSINCLQSSNGCDTMPKLMIKQNYHIIKFEYKLLLKSR